MNRSILLLLLISACYQKQPLNYESDKALISTNTDIIELTTNSGRSRILIAPKYQGKVLATSYHGLEGQSNGWLNREALKQPNISGESIGGEDRLWIGPLGGQYSFYYQQVKPLSEDNWSVPSTMNEEPYTLIHSNPKRVIMQKDMHLVNFIGAEFDMRIERKVTILDNDEIEQMLGIELPKLINLVAYESQHKLINIGKNTWKKETGLVSIWSLGMFNGSDETKMWVPLPKQVKKEIIYQYFGSDYSERLVIHDDLLSYQADGKYRSKIGIPGQISLPVFGSYSRDQQKLTIIQYQKTSDNLYFNSLVEIQDEPYTGEAVSCYNHGPMDLSVSKEPAFYELESSSAMKETGPDDTLEHYHRVFHFSASHSTLIDIGQQLGIDLNAI